ncbi:MAG: fibronectin type III domain-containing protein [Bacteroidetes bacterium]|nr:fibronectin type III domain-containing protein [Bacteroidota bacterium]
MMKIQKRILFCLTCIFPLFIGCTNLATDPPSDGSSSTTLEIFSPVNGDSVDAGDTEINYLISTPTSIKFMELYVNGNFIRNYPPNSDGSQPKIYLQLNESFIGTSIDYYLIYYDFHETSLKSNDILDVQVVATVNPPFVPFNLHLINLTPGSVNLSWEDSSLLVSNYEIWRKINFDGTYQKYLDVEGNVFNINDENLDSAIMYSYKVKGFNQFGESEFSDEVNTFGVGSSGELYPPTNLMATARGTILVRIAWTDNSENENLFAIERRQENEVFLKIGVVDRNVTNFADSANGLIAGEKYYYRIKAYSNTDSAWSNESFTQTYWYDIIRPTNLQGIYLGDGKNVLTWNDDDDTNTIFEVERKVDGEEQFTTIASLPGDQSTYLDENLLPQQSYTYGVRSGDGVYYSDYSNKVTVVTGNNHP